METIAFHLAGNNPQDIDILVAYRRRFAEELGGPISDEVAASFMDIGRAYFLEEIDRNYICWYATVDGAVAAIAGMVVRRGPGNVRNPSGMWGYIMNVYTVPEHRRKGLSAMLMDKLVATGVERGIKAFELHATKEGEPVYIKSGFKLHPEPTYRKFVE